LEWALDRNNYGKDRSKFARGVKLQTEMGNWRTAAPILAGTGAKWMADWCRAGPRAAGRISLSYGIRSREVFGCREDNYGPSVEANAVSLRVHGKGNLGAKPRTEVVADILQSIAERRA